MKHFTTFVVNLLPTLIFSTASTLAQAQQIQRPTVTRATDLVLEYDARVPLGTDVIFKRKTDTAGASLIQAGLQVRVFRMDDGQSRPQALTTIGDCEVFLTSVYRLDSSPNNGLRFVRFSEGWINLSHSENSTKDTRWFLVFEQVGADHEQFRIKAADAPAYFSTGFPITVYDNNSIPFPAIKAEYERRRKDSTRLYQEVDAKHSGVPCYGYKRLTTELKTEDQLAYGEIALCDSATEAAEPG